MPSALKQTWSLYQEASASVLDNLPALLVVAALPAALLAGIGWWVLEQDLHFASWVITRSSIDALLGPTWICLGMFLAHDSTFFTPQSPGQLLDSIKGNYRRAFLLYLGMVALLHPLMLLVVSAVLLLMPLLLSDPFRWLRGEGRLYAQRWGWGGWMTRGIPLLVMATGWQVVGMFMDVGAMDVSAGMFVLAQICRALIAVWGWTILARLEQAFVEP